MATFDDLLRAVDETLKTGKLGVCVAVRVHVQTGDADADPATALAAAGALAERALQAPPVSVAARRDGAGRGWNALVTHAAGRTALLTVAHGTEQTQAVELLLVGNHGTAWLEGAERIKPPTAAAEDHVRRWRQAAEKSLELGTAAIFD